MKQFLREILSRAHTEYILFLVMHVSNGITINFLNVVALINSDCGQSLSIFLNNVSRTH
jgi:hypothetical protein